jgi:S-adenosylmethionine hydrolase
MRPPVVLVTDFGPADPWVAEVKGALHTAWSRWPGDTPLPPVVDGGHDIPRGDVRAGAWFLRRLWPSFPAGSVFLAVVDPGVGGDRLAVACRAHGRVFVGPAGGLLAWLGAAEDCAVVVLDRDLYRGRPDGGPVAATFHGRDVFAPAAAHLALGVPLDQVGSPADRGALGSEPPPAVGWSIRWIDRFGNAISDLARDSDEGRRLESGGAVRVGGALVHGPAVTYVAAPPGVPFWYWGSGGTLEIAVRDGDASRLLGLVPGLALALPDP